AHGAVQVIVSPNRQVQSEGAAPADLGFDADPPVHFLHYVAGQIQSQPNTGNVSVLQQVRRGRRAYRIGRPEIGFAPIKLVKEYREVFMRNTAPVVLYADRGEIAFVAGR